MSTPRLSPTNLSPTLTLIPGLLWAALAGLGLPAQAAQPSQAALTERVMPESIGVATTVEPASATRIRAPGALVGSTLSVADAVTQLRQGSVGRRPLQPYEVVLNGTSVGQTLLLQAEGELHADRETLKTWRIAREPTRRVVHGGQLWFALSEIPGFRSEINAETLTLELAFAGTAFLATELGNTAPGWALSPVEPMTFVSYDLSLDHTRRVDLASTRIGGFWELGHSNRWGLWSSSWVATAVSPAEAVAANAAQPATLAVRRLETAFTRLFLDEGMSLRVGDTLARASSTGNAFYYAGLQWVSSADLLPGPSRQAAPYLAGTADAPGSLQVYLNGVLRQTTRVPAGPFSVNQLPSVDGEGNVRLVVTDVLGRETVIDQRLFNHPGLLSVGRQLWAVDLGWVRAAPGRDNRVRYEQPMVTAFWRRGLADRLTAELRGSAAAGFSGAAMGVTAALPLRTAATVTWGVSATDPGLRGQQASVELNHRHGPFAAALRVARNEPGFRRVADRALGLPQRQSTFSVGYDTGHWGSWTVSAAEIVSADGAMQAVQSLTHAQRLGALGFLSLSVNRVRAESLGAGSTQAFLSLSVPLGPGFGALTQVGQGGAGSQLLSLQRAPQSAGAPFWRGSVLRQGGQTQLQAGMFMDTERALVNVEASRSESFSALRGGLRGSWVWLGGQHGGTRATQGGYAVVRAPGLPGVGVLREGVRVATTDGRGMALVGGLVPYAANRIQLQADDLPLHLEIENLEQTVVTTDRGGARAEFKVKAGRPALLLLQLEDGSPVPAGAELRVQGGADVSHVARKGLAYVSGLAIGSNRLELDWQGQRCDLDLQMPAGDGQVLVRLGPLVCKGVTK